MKTMGIEIGGCSFAFGAMPLESALRIMKSLGFEMVDLGVCLGNTQIHPITAALEPEQCAAEALYMLDELELRPVECFVMDFGEPINHPAHEVREMNRRFFRGLAKFAALARCRSVMLLPGVVQAEIGKERSFAIAVHELRELAKMSEDEGIQLNIEPCEPSIAQEPRCAAELCEQVPGLGLTLDYSHFIDPGYSQADIEPLHRYAKHFHARQASPGKRVETVDKGSIDFTRIISLLRQQDYQGVIAVEYVDCDITSKCGVNVLEESTKMRAELLRLVAETTSARQT